MPVDWDAEILGPVMAEFGEQITYLPRGASPIVITDAVFDEESAEIAIGEDAQLSTQRKPTCGIRIAALNGVAITSQSDTVIREKTGMAYIVKDPVPDGHGHVRLTLMTKGGQ